MAKLGCTCGHSILDQRDNLPYKGDIISDTKFFWLLDKIQELVELPIAATQTGTWQQFIKSHFDNPDAFSGLKNEDSMPPSLTGRELGCVFRMRRKVAFNTPVADLLHR